jgi:hypothetical protein
MIHLKQAPSVTVTFLPVDLHIFHRAGLHALVPDLAQRVWKVVTSKIPNRGVHIGTPDEFCRIRIGVQKIHNMRVKRYARADPYRAPPLRIRPCRFDCQRPKARQHALSEGEIDAGVSDRILPRISDLRIAGKLPQS